MSSVIVLLSTYNGEKYLKEQIDSILRQKDVDVSILVRDDGSSDGTIKILEEYNKQFGNFSYYQGVNCGPAKSFLDLLKTADEADYYAFSDQDDLWDDDKLSCAVRILKHMDDSKPLLYYSNLRVVDENLQFYRNAHSTKLYNPNKYSALTENLSGGCTAVMNYKTKRLITDRMPDYCTMHDTWIYTVCKILGDTVYDETPHMSYRQHGNNVVGTHLKKNRIKTIKEKIQRLFNRGLQPRYVTAINLYKCFGDIMDNEDREKVLKIINYKRSLKDRMNLFFDKDIRATTRYGNLRFRLHILWGTV